MKGEEAILVWLNKDVCFVENTEVVKKQGFTLIEILLVIVLSSLLSTVILFFLDPIDKINSAHDTKVENDIGQIVRAMEAYATVNGRYPVNADPLTLSGDLKRVPTPPQNYSAYAYGSGGASQWVCGQLKAKKYVLNGGSAWAWCSGGAKMGTVASCGSCPL